MNSYGDLLFDDENKRILAPTLIGYCVLDDKAFATICANMILKKDIDGVYYSKSGNLGFCINNDGIVQYHFDARRILLAEF